MLLACTHCCSPGTLLENGIGGRMWSVVEVSLEITEGNSTCFISCYPMVRGLEGRLTSGHSLAVRKFFLNHRGNLTFVITESTHLA